VTAWLALSKLLGHAKVSMTEKCAHLVPEHLRSEVVKTERPAQAAQQPSTSTELAQEPTATGSTSA